MPTRREYLNTGLTTSLSIGAMVSMSGCADLPFLGAGGGTNYANWLHAPGQFREDDHYPVSVMGLGTIHANDHVFGDALIDRVEKTFQNRFEATGLDIDDLDRVVTTNVAQIALGSFKETAVAEALEDAGYSQESETKGFATYANGDPESTTSPIHRQRLRAFAVGEDAIVRVPFFSPDPSPLDVVGRLVTINDGDGTRYSEESDAMALLTEELEEGYQVVIRTFPPREHHAPEFGRFEHSVGIGASRSLSGTTIEDQYVVVYEDEGPVEPGDLELWIDGMAGRGIIPSTLKDVEVSAENRVAVLRGSIAASEVSLADVTPTLTVEDAATKWNGRRETAPEARIEFEETPRGVSLTHTSGDPLGSNVVVYASNENGETEVPIRSVADDGQLTAGDTIWITSGPSVQSTQPDSGGSVPSGTEIGMVWRSQSGDQVTLIASHTTA